MLNGFLILTPDTPTPKALLRCGGQTNALAKLVNEFEKCSGCFF